MGTETREVWIVANLDGGYSVCDGSQSVFATKAEADADVEERVESAMDGYAWEYSEDEMNAVPRDENDCIDSLTHDYVPRDGNEMTNAQLLEAQERDHVSVWCADLSFDDLVALIEDEDSAREVWKLAGAMPFTREIEQWPELRAFSVGRIVRVWHYMRNMGHTWVVVADAQGNNKTAYERGYFEARELFNHFALAAEKEAVDSQGSAGEGSIATAHETHDA